MYTHAYIYIYIYTHIHKYECIRPLPPLPCLPTNKHHTIAPDTQKTMPPDEISQKSAL